MISMLLGLAMELRDLLRKRDMTPEWFCGERIWPYLERLQNYVASGVTPNNQHQPSRDHGICM